MSKDLYTSVVGCMMFAMVCIRPYLAHVVSVVSKYIANLRRQHWDAVKYIFKYLKGTTEYGMTFVRHKSDLLVVEYVDADYVRDLDDKKSTTGYVFTLVREPICWRSMIQSMVVMSKTNEEYIVAAKAAKEALCLTRLRELGIQQCEVSLY